MSTTPSGRGSPYPNLDGRGSPVREPTAGSYNQAVSRGRVDKRSKTVYTPSLSGHNPWASLFQSSGLSPAFLQPSETTANEHMRVEIESIPDSSVLHRSSASANSEAETHAHSVPSTSPQNLSGVEESVKERPGCKSVADYFMAVPGSKENSPGRLAALQNSANAKYLDQQGLTKTVTSTLSAADAEEMLNNFKNHKLEPPKAFYESPEARQKVIETLEAETRGINEPGGSWVPRPGHLPYARALPKSPDKDYLDHSTSLGAERHSLLKRLRWAFFSVNKDHHFRVMDYFARYDEDGSGCITRNSFFRLLREVSFEVSSADYDLLITLFQSRRKRSYMDYVEFTYRMFEATKELRINNPETDRDELANRMRQSCVFDHLNTLRPMSRSGRMHTMSDIHKQVSISLMLQIAGCDLFEWLTRNHDLAQIDKPLVLPAGIGTVPGRYQFLSDHERQKLQKKFPEPSAPRDARTAQTRTAASQPGPGFGHFHAESVSRPAQGESPKKKADKQASAYKLMIDEDEHTATEKITQEVQMLSLSPQETERDDTADPCKRAQTPPILKGVNGRISSKERHHSVTFTEDVKASPTATLEKGRAGWEANLPHASAVQQPMKMIRPLAGTQPAVTPSEYLPTIDGTTRRVSGHAPPRPEVPSGVNDEQDAIRRMTAAEVSIDA